MPARHACEYTLQSAAALAATNNPIPLSEFFIARVRERKREKFKTRKGGRTKNK